MKWQCCCRPFNVALGDVSGGPLRSCAPVYGSVRLFSDGHYPAFAELLATGIPAAYYAGIKEEESISRLAPYPVHVWSYKFIFERTEDDNTLKFLTIVEISVGLPAP